MKLATKEQLLGALSNYVEKIVKTSTQTITKMQVTAASMSGPAQMFVFEEKTNGAKLYLENAKMALAVDKATAVKIRLSIKQNITFPVSFDFLEENAKFITHEFLISDNITDSHSTTFVKNIQTKKGEEFSKAVTSFKEMMQAFGSDNNLCNVEKVFTDEGKDLKTEIRKEEKVK